MAIAEVGRKYIRRVLAAGLIDSELGSCRPNRTDLPVAFGVGKVNVPLIGVQPASLQSLGFGNPEPREQY